MLLILVKLNLSWVWCFCLILDNLTPRWVKVRFKYRLKSKSKVISLSKSLRPKIRSKYILRPKLSRTNWLKSVEFAWKRYLMSLYFLTFAERKSKSKVKLNFGLSPDFSLQLKVSLSESLSEMLSQKLKWPIVLGILSISLPTVTFKRVAFATKGLLAKVK